MSAAHQDPSFKSHLDESNSLSRPSAPIDPFGEFLFILGGTLVVAGVIVALFLYPYLVLIVVGAYLLSYGLRRP